MSNGDTIAAITFQSDGRFREQGILAGTAWTPPAGGPLRHGPVRDALGTTSDGQSIFVKAKAHIAELASPPTRASPTSRERIERSLAEARRYYAPKATAGWSGVFYQYANRLAHHYLLHRVNDLPAHLVFLYFLNTSDVGGPNTEGEWRGAIRLLHAVLGLVEPLRDRNVYEVFVDAALLRDVV